MFYLKDKLETEIQECQEQLNVYKSKEEENEYNELLSMFLSAFIYYFNKNLV